MNYGVEELAPEPEQPQLPETVADSGGGPSIVPRGRKIAPHQHNMVSHSRMI